MSWIDWILFAIPVAIVVAAAVRAQRYVHGVADFLSAGRIAHRYVICVASGEAAYGLVSLVGNLEAHYNSGFAYGFWGSVLSPLAMALGLVGYCTYRFRETRAMTLGQFFEIRYSRAFRLTAGGIQLLACFVNYAIFPAVSARFLMYFMRLPISFVLFGFRIPTFSALMLAALALACFIACAGGQITIMVTDCIQGILNYPIYLLVVVYLLCRFSWWRDLLPAISARPEGMSFLNPFDTSGLRDFNVFYVVSGILGLFFSRMLWGGTGYQSAAKDAHEAKMGAVLGTWRNGFSSIMFTLIAALAYAWFNHPKFAEASHATGAVLAATAYADVTLSAEAVPAGEVGDVAAAFAATRPRTEFTSRDEYLALGEAVAQQARFKAESTSPFLAAASDVLGGDKSEAEIQAMSAEEKADWSSRRSRYQKFATIFRQQCVAAAIRDILPHGLLGLFCALAVFMMLTTDTTYIHGLASVAVQDCLLPLRGEGKTWTPHQQITRLRIAVCCIGIGAFLFGNFFGQIDFVLMFFAITGAVWNTAGPVFVFGLYWKRGTTQAAFAAMLTGSSLAVSAIFAQKLWVPSLYPWIATHGWAERLDSLLRALSAPMEPWIHWELTPDKFPISSAEVGVFTSLFTILLYVAVSLATCRKAFNMERLLHRGKYALHDVERGMKGAAQMKGDAAHQMKGESTSFPPKADTSFGGKAATLHSREAGSSLLRSILGIDRNYTRGDRALAWSVFLYSFGWGFCLCFLGNVLWHVLGEMGILPRQPDSWWGVYFFIVNFAVACVVGVVSTFWFGICSVRDLLRLFRDLDERERLGSVPDDLDDGRVVETTRN